MSDASNAKDKNYKIWNFIWREKRQNKRIKNNFPATKTIENPKIVDIKSVNIEYPKTLNKVF